MIDITIKTKTLNETPIAIHTPVFYEVLIFTF